MSRIFLALAFLFVFTALPQAHAQALDPAGIWLTEKGDAKVRVTRCGSGVCGVVIWLRDPIDPATGKPQVDDKNEDPRLAKRPIIGLSLFSGMRPSGANKWSGRIYNADDGKSYDSHVSVTAPDALRVEGCVGAFCGGETWTRTTR
ncbi:MAG: hypothetical protein A4S14_14495 [Proteobacteria bacterium SG_bin9]|nr:MAG: hypothetical protein A4S14_14495 [Proteobacteria bacterium SG_bin9]